MIFLLKNLEKTKGNEFVNNRRDEKCRGVPARKHN